MPKEKISGTIRKEATGRRLKSSRKAGGGVSATSPVPSRRVDGYIKIRTDSAGTIRGVNPYGEAFFGKSENGLLGKKFAEIVLPDYFDFDRRKKRFINHFLHTPGKNDFAEFETRHTSGSPRRVAWSRHVVRDPCGPTVEMLYLGIDVHGKAAAAAGFSPPGEADAVSGSLETGIGDSNSNHSLLERFIEGSNVWAWEMGPEMGYCYVSPGIEKVLGYSPDELCGVKKTDLPPSNWQRKIREVLTASIQAGSRHFSFENQSRCKNGKQVWTETSGVIFYDETGAFLGARGLNRDISPEMAAKQELALREQEYRYLFDNTQVALFMTNEAGVILNINRTGAKMHGRTPEEMIGHKFTEFVPESERESAFEAFQKGYRHAKSQKSNFVDIEPYVTRLDTPQGDRYLRLVPKAIKVMENDRMVAILSTALDATESHILHEALADHQQKLQQLVNERTEAIQSLQEEMLRNERLTALGMLTSTVSHEIRNPLGTISSSLYILNERLKEKDFGVGPAIERGFRAIQRCDGIIEEMLDFTRTKGLDKRMLDISSWLESLLDETHLPKNVSVVRQISPGLSAPVDAGRLQRCLSNILQNSLTALQGSGDGTIRVRARMAGGRLEISITDTGPGISKKLQKRIFDPLYSTKQNGIGMGLPVCRQVMELHGGSIHLRSDIGRGTTVVLRLPVPLEV